MNDIVLALDQSSRTTGWAIFKNGELSKYDKFTVDNPDIATRLIIIKERVKQIIAQENVTYVVIEDIQMQGNINNVVTFKTLAFVMATILILCKERNITCQIVSSSTWKSKCGIKGKTRVDQKKDAQRFVQEDFGVKVTQDEADAICLGYSVIKENSNRIDWA